MATYYMSFYIFGKFNDCGGLDYGVNGTDQQPMPNTGPRN
jgi:hypothetical protein